jgi:hypothetical protein
MGDFSLTVHLPIPRGSTFHFRLSVLSPTHNLPYIMRLGQNYNLTNNAGFLPRIFGHKMTVGVTRLPFTCSIESLDYKQCNQPDCFCLRITGQTTDPNACHYISKPPGLRLSSSWGKGPVLQIQPSYCCLQIDDDKQVVTNIATDIRKIAYIPVQTWDGWKPNHWLGGWFSWLFPPLGPNAVFGAVLFHASLTFLCVLFLLTKIPSNSKCYPHQEWTYQIPLQTVL